MLVFVVFMLWIPAFAGMTKVAAGMVKVAAGMTLPIVILADAGISMDGKAFSALNFRLWL